MVGLLSRNRQWVHQEYFSSFWVVPVDFGKRVQRREKNLIVIPFLSLAFSCTKFSGSNVPIP